MNPFWFGNPTALGQQTLATQMLTRMAPGNGATGVRRRRKRKSTAKRAAPRKSARGVRKAKRARLVKGSAAAKAYMAKIRRKRRK
jgi:hypothetical protein